MAIHCVLMDIEGTIIPTTFVRDVLFPYAKRHLVDFLREHEDDGAIRPWTAACLDTGTRESGRALSYSELPDLLARWIEQDRKHPGLKAIQGMIWEEGYRTGRFAPALYGDVPAALNRWRQSGLQLALYSSGSEQAQRLLLAHTPNGDLTGLFSRFFDTRVGPKKELASYRTISEQLELRPETILFLSDIEAELDAAGAAGFQTIHIVRPETDPGTRHPICSTFGDLYRADSTFNEMMAP